MQTNPVDVSADLERAEFVGPKPSQVDWSEAVLVNFWQSQCEPCETEMPILQRAYKGSGLEVVGVSLDKSSASAREFLKRTGATYPNLLDTASQLKVAFSESIPVVGLPTSFIVVDGTIRAVHVGPFYSTSDVLAYRELPS